MVCFQPALKQQQENTADKFVGNCEEAALIKNNSCTHFEPNHAVEMNFSGAKDALQLQYLAGCNITSHPPLFSANGEFIFLISDAVIKIYSTTTGELARELRGAPEKIISMELELRQPQTLVTCNSAGQVNHWHWSTGELKNQQNLILRKAEVLGFKLINMYKNSDTACAVATMRCEGKIQWFIFNTTTGERVYVPCLLRLPEESTPLLDASTNNFKLLVLVQDFTVYFINYETWQWRNLRNAHRVPITVIRVHPTEDLVATGDEMGKVFLWRQYMNPKTVTTSLYHWHHTAVTSIAFSGAGSSFYSSGLESVLVKWNIERTDIRDFLPRTSSIIRHIAVSGDNSKVAMSTADNGVQFVGSDNQLKSTLQEFTYNIDDKTGKSKFPVGLKLNPRSNTLVLNGRIGHLQFYSTHTNNLLYNLDIVQQNRLSIEKDKILYNINVTKAAFNIDWMATGEVYNDEQFLPELRLKFWKYQEETQSYMLNTNIELPHEGGFRAIEFNNAYRVDNLLCATAGDDNIIRVWSLEDSDNIYKQGKVWYCIAQTSYKGVPIEALSFSQDGSLLAAGYGNTLCVYKANTLKLKAALTGSAGQDGCLQQAQVCVSSNGQSNDKSARNAYIERRKRLLTLFTSLLENNDETLIREIQKTMQAEKKQKKIAKPPNVIEPEPQKAYLYNKILQMPELNLYQKLLLYQRLGIRCEVPQDWRQRMVDYLSKTISIDNVRGKMKKLHAQVHRLNMRSRFKAKYRLQQYENHKRHYDAEVAQHLVPLMNVLSMSDTSKPKANKQKSKKMNGIEGHDESEALMKQTEAKSTVPPLQTPAQITHVQFAAGEYAHLVVVCTETRLLIWNLLNLRLHAMLKLSVKNLAFDPQNNLIAVFTKYNELHIFQPNVPLAIYQRSNLPELFGAIWLPRPRPKQRSINLDWQAQSTLYFLTEKQEIMYLGSSKEAADAVTPITLNSSTAMDATRYTTFGAFATKQHSDTVPHMPQHLGPLVLGNRNQAVKSFVEMCTHTMPPLSLLCGELIRSMAKPAESALTHEKLLSSDAAADLVNGAAPQSAHTNGQASHSESETEDAEDVAEDEKTKSRKSLLQKSEQFSKAGQRVEQAATTDLEAQLQRIATQQFDFEF